MCSCSFTVGISWEILHSISLISVPTGLNTVFKWNTLELLYVMLRLLLECHVWSWFDEKCKVSRGREVCSVCNDICFYFKHKCSLLSRDALNWFMSMMNVPTTYMCNQCALLDLKLLKSIRLGSENVKKWQYFEKVVNNNYKLQFLQPKTVQSCMNWHIK